MTGILIIMMIMTTLMIYFGITSLNDCPMKRAIPIYLLVGGCAGVLKVLILILKNRKIRKEDENIDDEPTSDIETYDITFVCFHNFINYFLHLFQG